MKKINKPEDSIDIILDNCINHMYNPRKGKIIQVRKTIKEQTDKYDELALAGQLFTIHEHDNVDLIATKDDMIMLYEEKFVPESNKDNRMVYDKIMLSAPNGKCPYCQQNIADTLDHFLPKAKYVTFSVTPYNLVPSCWHCNTDKWDATFGTYSDQPFHPYYDNFDDSIWLKSKLIENEVISFQFYADPPSCIATDKADRIRKSFSTGGFGLNDVYKIHASEVYQACSHRIKILFGKGGKDLAVARLLEYIEDEKSINDNSWKAALYRAMIDSDWYWEVYLPGCK